MLRTTLAASVSVALALGILGASGCIVPSISTNADAGTTATASGDAGTSATVEGASCTQITSAISLCQFISACPSFSLNTAVFPQCGFHIHGSAIDPECLCDNQYLCPVGHPLTCAAAAQAAAGDTSYDSVCQQVVTGGCQDLSTGTGTTSTACQQCVNACDNVPSCIDACGC